MLHVSLDYLYAENVINLDVALYIVRPKQHLLITVFGKQRILQSTLFLLYCQ